MGLLDSAGMQKLWTKIKSKFVEKDSNGKATVAELKVTDSGIDCEGVLEAHDGASFGGSVEVKYGETLRLYNEDNSKSADMCCESDGKLSLNGKAVATVDDIPSDSNFVTKDENGDVTVESLQADNGITCVGVLDVREGYSARFFSNDNSKNASLCCDDNGKLTLDGKEVATVDDIPSGGGSGDSSIIDLGTQGSHKDAQQAMVDYVLELPDEYGCLLFKYYCNCYCNACFAIVFYYHDVEANLWQCRGTVYDNDRGSRKFSYDTIDGFFVDGCWEKITTEGSGSGGTGLSMPRIRLANHWQGEDGINYNKLTTEWFGSYIFSVEIMDGTVQEGDQLQICSLTNHKNSRGVRVRKPRRFSERIITAEDIEMLSYNPYLQILVEGNYLRELYRSCSSDGTLYKYPKYIRIRRPKYDENGQEIGATFSNVVCADVRLPVTFWYGIE